ncbi:protein ANTAGONIST OF LIKE HETEROCHROMATIN PROTEIN 1-like [Nematostella vectensis]|uniref:protein ANTAGONIST OF LIKE HETEROCHROMATIN PROTEIN 1-like n=1 Tax=Nematostella vectensis TaxID=45351 RepID=UPI0020771ED6|nr:protein ANTAGONIST OF LIKE HETEROCHROMATIN PROTEIN 1-like [Nematostella vectensis]
MLQDYIKIPVGEELDKVVAEFKHKWGFPQCVGAIDGSHIPVKAPIEFHADYYNRKGWYSIILQGAVDSRYRFIDINVGWPGKVHDARVFSNSSIFTKGQNKTLFPKEQFADIDGVKVPLFITADAAYPLLPWVMKPFSDNGSLGPEKMHFNYRLSRARILVENAFGRLKGRWRCLLKQNEN